VLLRQSAIQCTVRPNKLGVPFRVTAPVTFFIRSNVKSRIEASEALDGPAAKHTSQSVKTIRNQLRHSSLFTLRYLQFSLQSRKLAAQWIGKFLTTRPTPEYIHEQLELVQNDAPSNSSSTSHPSSSASRYFSWGAFCSPRLAAHSAQSPPLTNRHR